MRANHTTTLAGLVAAGAMGIFLATGAAAEDQKRALVRLAQAPSIYQVQLDRVRHAMVHGDQAQLNDAMLLLFGILGETPTTSAGEMSSNDSFLGDEMKQIISIQDERSGTSF